MLSHKTPRLLAGFGALAGAIAFGQDLPVRPTFEVASVRQYAPPRDGSPVVTMRCGGGPGTADPERLSCTNAPLGMLISMAYGVQYYQVSGPAWIGTDGYDVSAKIPAGVSQSQYRLMLQQLLAERFQLVLKHTSKDMLSYTLVTAKGGSKMQRSGANDPAPPGFAYASVGGRTRVTVRKRGLEVLAGFLSTKLGVEGPVANETGLAGEYDFVLEFTPEAALAGDPVGLSVFTALESQLGLKLEVKKTPVDILVVDRTEKKPTDN